MTYDFQAVKGRLSIADLFSADGHELKRMGRRYRCLSPFNAEKTPSCYVDEDRGRFKCFSSGSSGDIFDYIILTHGCGLEDAYKILAQRAGLSIGGDWVNAPRPVPKPRPKIEEEKPLQAMSGVDLECWNEGVGFLKLSTSTIRKIAEWRGLDEVTVLELAQRGKIGCVELSDYLRRQDPQDGLRRVAFPVEGIIDGEIKQVAYHVRLKPRPGEKKASWRFCPSGVGAWPYILGDVESAKFLFICEGQWDAIAICDSLGIGMEAMFHEEIAIAAMRGAQNWRLFVEHYLLRGLTQDHVKAMAAPKEKLKLRPRLKCLVICDADDAGETWTTGVDDQPSFVQILQAVCGHVYVREPLEGFGKDFNDILKTVKSKPIIKNENQTPADLRAS